MQYAIIDDRGIYRGLVDAIAATPPDVGSYAPQGVRISVLGCPPTDEAGKWRDDGAAWLELTPAEVEAARLAEIDARLGAIDAESIRPLRAVEGGNATDFDRQKLVELEAEAAALREERKGMAAQAK